MENGPPKSARKKKAGETRSEFLYVPPAELKVLRVTTAGAFTKPSSIARRSG